MSADKLIKQLEISSKLVQDLEIKLEASNRLVKDLENKLKSVEFDVSRLALFISQDEHKFHRFIDISAEIVEEERKRKIKEEEEIRAVGDTSRAKKYHILHGDPILLTFALEKGKQVLPQSTEWKLMTVGTGVGIAYACADAVKKYSSMLNK